MLAIHDRIAELWAIKQKQDLTTDQTMEMDICLKAHADWVWRMKKLENLSYLASMTDDVNWQLEICSRIDELTITGKESSS